MTVVWAEQALLADGWAQDVRITIDKAGRIAGIEPGAAPDGQRLGVVLPAPANSHSHAFQRAMAGLTERRGADSRDCFWTWRQLMYRFLDSITPEQVQAIAAMVQMEMLEAGFAVNVEFHYLHHQPDGTPYDRPGEMSARIAAAAQETGIGLTLLPVRYEYGGCDQRPLGAGQRRFGTTADGFDRLLDDARHVLTALPGDSRLGVAPHSLRAVSREDLRQIGALVPDGPVHLHIAEQIAEVEEVSAAWGCRPVEWALDNLPLDARWTMIHATQMQPHETEGLAATGAVAGLCPLTEASLGDGIFDGVRWLDHNGRISIGSDSNIRISLAEEMRLLDTTQRLRDHTRAALASSDQSAGRRIYQSICEGGAMSAGRESGVIGVGQWADLLALDMTHPDLAGLTGDTILDSFAFTGDNRMVADVWSAGRHMVQEGCHTGRAEIVAAYARAVAPLRDGM